MLIVAPLSLPASLKYLVDPAIPVICTPSRSRQQVTAALRADLYSCSCVKLFSARPTPHHSTSRALRLQPPCVPEPYSTRVQGFLQLCRRKTDQPIAASRPTSIPTLHGLPRTIAAATYSTSSIPTVVSCWSTTLTKVYRLTTQLPAVSLHAHASVLPSIESLSCHIWDEFRFQERHLALARRTRAYQQIDSTFHTVTSPAFCITTRLALASLDHTLLLRARPEPIGCPGLCS